MKKRWLCRMLNEAPLPALVLAFAVTQSRVGVTPKWAPLASRGHLVAVQVDQGVQRSVDSRELVSKLDRLPMRQEPVFWLFSAKTQSALKSLTAIVTDQSSNTDQRKEKR